MKNYLGFFIILLLLVTSLTASSLFLKNAESGLLEVAEDLKHSEDKALSFNRLKDEFKSMEKRLTMLVNHNQYREICKCIIRLEVDIRFENERNISADIDELIFLIKEITEGEKCSLNNIF